MNSTMRLLIILLILFFTFTAKAETAFPGEPGWEVERQCLGELPYPTIPQSEWTFEGVIFSWNREGIRAIRTDVDTSYFVALDGDSSFALDGVFSPDGRWFAYAKGVTEYNNMISNIIGIHELSVVSTDPQHQTLSIPWRAITYTGVSRNIPRIQWFDNEHIGLPEGEIGDYVGQGIVNVFSGGIKPWNHTVDLYLLYAFSPDFSHALIRDWHDQIQPVSLYNLSDETLVPLETSDDSVNLGYVVEWLPDASGFIASMSYVDSDSKEHTVLALFDKDGAIAEFIAQADYFGDAAISSDGNKIAFTAKNQLFIADIKSKTVADLCFTINSPGLIWSPESTQLVFLDDRYPIIFNIQTRTMQILRYQTDGLIGWYSLNAS